MSSKTTIIWLLVAVVLGAAALLLVRTGGGPGGGSVAGQVAIGQPVMQIDPASVRSIAVIHPDGGRETMTRGSGDGPEWAMTVIVPGSAGSVAPGERPAWPVPTSRVQALLRQLNDVRARAAAAKEAALGERPIIVSIDSGDRGTVSLRLAERSLAGQALIEVETAPGEGAGSGAKPAMTRALVDDTLHLLFRDHAPREWRDRTALSGDGLDASRISLRNNLGSTLSLGRVNGAWSIREPFSTPADPAAIQRLLSMVGSVQIVDFLDQGVAAASTRLETPAAEVVIETDRRETPASGTGDQPGTIVTTSRELEIGGAADSGGARLFARIDSQRTVVIDARAVADLKLDPTLYVWPHPTRLNAADIGTIAMERSAAPSAAGDPGSAPGTVFRRALDRWKQIRADGQEISLPENDTRPIRALLVFLCGPDAAAAAPPAGPAGSAGPTAISAAAPEGYAVRGRITLLSLSGAPLDALEVGTSTASAITLRSGNVYRSYSLDRVPSLIAEFTEPPPPAPGTSSTQAPEPGK
jgi:hypothetical protein